MFKVLYLYMHHNTTYTQLVFELTFLPACLRASASSVVMVLLPTPPFPDRTNTTCWTWARLPTHMKRRGKNELVQHERSRYM